MVVELIGCCFSLPSQLMVEQGRIPPEVMQAHL
jgi:hypothetical protein